MYVSCCIDKIKLRGALLFQNPYALFTVCTIKLDTKNIDDVFYV
jgi:hypothetical protein